MESKLILRYTTTWPRQSDQHVKLAATSYSKKTSFLSTVSATIISYIVKKVLKIPPLIQDMILQVLTTLIFGYSSILLIHLYNIYTFLPFMVLFVILLLIHIIILNSDTKDKLKLKELHNQRIEKYFKNHLHCKETNVKEVYDMETGEHHANKDVTFTDNINSDEVVNDVLYEGKELEDEEEFSQVIDVDHENDIRPAESLLIDDLSVVSNAFTTLNILNENENSMYESRIDQMLSFESGIESFLKESHDANSRKRSNKPLPIISSQVPCRVAFDINRNEIEECNAFINNLTDFEMGLEQFMQQSPIDSQIAPYPSSTGEKISPISDPFYDSMRSPVHFQSDKSIPSYAHLPHANYTRNSMEETKTQHTATHIDMFGTYESGLETFLSESIDDITGARTNRKKEEVPVVRELFLSPNNKFQEKRK
jgi:hypothetical protein